MTNLIIPFSKSNALLSRRTLLTGVIAATTTSVAMPWVSRADAPPRTRLSASRTYYLRADGSDSNNGLVNSAAGAWATPQAALDYIADNLDFNGFNVTLMFATAGPNNGKWALTRQLDIPNHVGRGILLIQGPQGDETTVVIDGLTNKVKCLVASGGAEAWVRFMSLEGINGVTAWIHGRIYYGNLRFGECDPINGSHVYAGRLGYSEQIGPVSIYGGAAQHLESTHQGNYRNAGQSIMFSADATFRQFVRASSLGDITFTAHVPGQIDTRGHVVTGRRYLADEGGVIQTLSGPDYFPGSIEGKTETGGQYV